MAKAARAIVIEGDKILVMHRNKHGSEYFTLVGGRQHEDETTDEALVREVKEETGLDITDAKLVFVEEHPAPYNEQYIYLCKVAPHQGVSIQDSSEEGFMNRISINTHRPIWAELGSFSKLNFRTPQLQDAIVESIKKGFPDQPVKL
jgi:ADP-ribose pyrophosphatase YjhB (NUDIX family)